ncbi:hypothetical protein TrVFT333_009489 [Trichoderma virens FT-333]|nr:hypothetical protein TrVFT333_009489 [Trichoderma virens FT-333]
MSPQGTKKDTQKRVIMLSYKNLIRLIANEPPQLVKKGDPEWQDGIHCLYAYQSQATVLSRVDQEEMMHIICHFKYIIPPSAENDPTLHPLMIAENEKIKKRGSPSWAVYIILKTLYGTALPSTYVERIHKAFGTTDVDDHTHEYLAIDGTEPVESTESAEPAGEIPCRRFNNRRRGCWRGRNPKNVVESNNENRRDSIYLQLAKTVAKKPAAEEARCNCAIGQLEERMDKFEAALKALEKKMDEKSEAQTNELQAIRKAVEAYAEASTSLLEIATGKRLAAPEGADV